MNATASIVAPGTRIVSVRQVPGFGRVYVAPAVYTAVARDDGVVTWRCTDAAPARGWLWLRNGRQTPRGFRSDRLAWAAAHDLATALGCDVVADIRHGSRA